MTRRDYVHVAALLRARLVAALAAGNDRTAVTVRAIAVDLADVFADDNPRFDRDRFLTACWPTD